MLLVGQFDTGRDGLGMRSRGGEVAVKGVGVVVFWDRQRPNEFIEVAFVALAVRLEVSDIATGRRPVLRSHYTGHKVQFHAG
jgi:hypothetical protein